MSFKEKKSCFRASAYSRKLPILVFITLLSTVLTSTAQVALFSTKSNSSYSCNPPYMMTPSDSFSANVIDMVYYMTNMTPPIATSVPLAININPSSMTLVSPWLNNITYNSFPPISDQILTLVKKYMADPTTDLTPLTGYVFSISSLIANYQKNIAVVANYYNSNYNKYKPPTSPATCPRITQAQAISAYLNSTSYMSDISTMLIPAMNYLVTQSANAAATTDPTKYAAAKITAANALNAATNLYNQFATFPATSQIRNDELSYYMQILGNKNTTDKLGADNSGAVLAAIQGFETTAKNALQDAMLPAANAKMITADLATANTALANAKASFLTLTSSALAANVTAINTSIATIQSSVDSLNGLNLISAAQVASSGDLVASVDPTKIQASLTDVLKQQTTAQGTYATLTPTVKTAATAMMQDIGKSVDGVMLAYITAQEAAMAKLSTNISSGTPATPGYFEKAQVAMNGLPANPSAAQLAAANAVVTAQSKLATTDYTSMVTLAGQTVTNLNLAYSPSTLSVATPPVITIPATAPPAIIALITKMNDEIKASFAITDPNSAAANSFNQVANLGNTAAKNAFTSTLTLATQTNDKLTKNINDILGLIAQAQKISSTIGSAVNPTTMITDINSLILLAQKIMTDSPQLYKDLQSYLATLAASAVKLDPVKDKAAIDTLALLKSIKDPSSALSQNNVVAALKKNLTDSIVLSCKTIYANFGLRPAGVDCLQNYAKQLVVPTNRPTAPTSSTLSAAWCGFYAYYEPYPPKDPRYDKDMKGCIKKLTQGTALP